MTVSGAGLGISAQLVSCVFNPVHAAAPTAGGYRRPCQLPPPHASPPVLLNPRNLQSLTSSSTFRAYGPLGSSDAPYWACNCKL